MTSETILSNANIVMPDRLIEGAVRIREGRIAAVDPGRSRVGAAQDLQGDFLIPGIVDVHTDHLEQHLEPRPGVKWPGLAALVSHDRQIAGAGITTVLDSLSMGFDLSREGRQVALQLAMDTLGTAKDEGLLKADHMLHLRCELPAPTLLEDVRRVIGHPLVRLASVMDHTPGQRQWRNLDKWRTFNSRRYNPEQMNEMIAVRQERQRLYVDDNRRALVPLFRERGLSVASHDDTTADHVREAHESGVTISEFPTTLEAARLAHGMGMKTVMGAPNLVMGGSHSGNVAALELAREGVLNGFASDYVPNSMIQSAFMLHVEHGFPLHQTVGWVTSEPAAMVRLEDRGRIAEGLRADLVRVKLFRGTPVIRQVWLAGERVI
ncbi:MAG: alpha-D-ribose 1-methylphosphonate 5-triphosphate diphosphatase [Rhodospirillales bacterium]|nr:alpha-D-ribose 1-methylphosphonate 5-triphosphate diphosphatase [Rhodospirillales bacterium]